MLQNLLFNLFKSESVKSTRGMDLKLRQVRVCIVHVCAAIS